MEVKGQVLPTMVTVVPLGAASPGFDAALPAINNGFLKLEIVHICQHRCEQHTCLVRLKEGWRGFIGTGAEGCAWPVMVIYNLNTFSCCHWTSSFFFCENGDDLMSWAGVA